MAAWVVATLMAAGCLQPALPGGPAVDAGPVTTPGWTVTLVDADRRAFEPGLSSSPDGTWYICALKGFPNGTNVWVSHDQGRSFRFIGDDLPIGTARSGGGDVGGGDCDIGTDASGRAYLVDLWAGSASIATSTDGGSTWTGVPVSQLAPTMDRPWLAGGSSNEVLIEGAQLAARGCEQHGFNCPPPGGIWVSRSTDGGRTFLQQMKVVDNANRLELNGNIARGGDGALYVIYTEKVGEGKLALTVASSADDGLTWTPHEVARQDFPPGSCYPLNVFPVVGADASGGVNAAWVLDNSHTGRYDLFLASSRDHGQHWSAPLVVTDRPGARAYPWLAVRADGLLALAWYETNVTTRQVYGTDPLGQAHATCEWEGADQAAWYVRTAFSSNASAPNPHIVEQTAQTTPVHVGSLDRPYAERMGLAFGSDGRAGVVYVADLAAKPRVVFAIQDVPQLLGQVDQDSGRARGSVGDDTRVLAPLVGTR